MCSLKTRSGETKYPDLRKCISLIFSSPFSNVPAEHLFYLLKLIKTDIRNSFRECHTSLTYPNQLMVEKRR